MRDTDLYRQLLGIESPWTVSRVDLKVNGQRVDVWASHEDGSTWPCSECGEQLPLYDHSPERTWRHLDSCQFKTYLHATTPRVDCPLHGVKQVKLPWAESKSRFTSMFQRLAIEVLKETSVMGATRILNISWEEAWHIMERAVARGLLAKKERVVSKIGVDEKAFAKGHKYVTIVCDLQSATVEYVGIDRKSTSLDEYFMALNPAQLAGIEAVATDMWDPFLKSIRAHVKDADSKIVFDCFHIMKHMGKAVDTVRKQEHRGFLREDGESPLTGTKYLWLYKPSNLPEHQTERFEELRAADLKTGRAWAIKETLRSFWTYERVSAAARHFKKWFFWATHSKLQPVIAAARTLERHLPNILTFFSHRITNAVAEGLNSKIQTVKKRAYGFRNIANFKTAIYFHCGGLELYPPLSTTHAEA